MNTVLQFGAATLAAITAALTPLAEAKAPMAKAETVTSATGPPSRSTQRPETDSAGGSLSSTSTAGTPSGSSTTCPMDMG